MAGEGLTKLGIDILVERILKRSVEVPKELTADELMEWLNGYTSCQQTILNIIEDMRKGQWE